MKKDRPPNPIEERNCVFPPVGVRYACFFASLRAAFDDKNAEGRKDIPAIARAFHDHPAPEEKRCIHSRINHSLTMP